MQYHRLSMSDFLGLLKRAHINLKCIEVITEIGALDGTDSLELKKNIPQAHCYSIEGLKSNYETYLRHLKGIRTFNSVITDYDGTIKYYEKENQGIHGIFPSNWSKTITVQRLKCYRFDTFVKLKKLPPP